MADSLAAASVPPSGLYARTLTTPSCSPRVAVIFPPGRSHTSTTPATGLNWAGPQRPTADARLLPSGLYARARTRSALPRSVARSLPVVAFRRLIEPSRFAGASVRPSGPYATGSASLPRVIRRRGERRTVGNILFSAAAFPPPGVNDWRVETSPPETFLTR